MGIASRFLIISTTNLRRGPLRVHSGKLPPLFLWLCCRLVSDPRNPINCSSQLQ
ncbi:hypothetical protein FIBSPDRAFT_876391 [Athelia psychrophila]|uniref:Uncharacterized protein n=1 Tax=Athelia psychrophila TaxID=1759441 RepID=A0A167WY28_9AGAM|nr:hypothetical protein FIBSPDRAFT_876391 [Fibularhizoctonia sp. CBS 109695]